MSSSLSWAYFRPGVGGIGFLPKLFIADSEKESARMFFIYSVYNFDIVFHAHYLSACVY